MNLGIIKRATLTEYFVLVLLTVKSGLKGNVTKRYVYIYKKSINIKCSFVKINITFIPYRK